MKITLSLLFYLFFTVVHICGHVFNLTNLTQSLVKGNNTIEEILSQLDDPWVNPIREGGHVSYNYVNIFI